MKCVNPHVKIYKQHAGSSRQFSKNGSNTTRMSEETERQREREMGRESERGIENVYAFEKLTGD